MRNNLNKKLEQLRADYTEVAGQPPDHFYCPILFKDEKVELCQAHIINKAFSNSSRAWTVQRKDVDNFYGSIFETDFEKLQYTNGTKGKSLGDIFMDNKLRKKFNPKISINGKSTDYFVASDAIPPNFSPFEFEKDGKSILIGIKISPDIVASSSEMKLEIDISHDLRITAMVSLIKAAYLTLFEIVGYRYVFSAAGHFVGNTILGKFFIQNRGKHKSKVLESAISFFRDFKHMVRPILSSGFDFQGTISDRITLICRGSSGYNWAIVLFIRTGPLLHAVMLPVSDRPDMVPTYLDFLKNQNESIKVNLCSYEQSEKKWNANKEPTLMTWPKTGILYPE